MLFKYLLCRNSVVPLQKVIELEPVEKKSKVLGLIPKLRLSGGIFSPISSCPMCAGIVAIR